MRRLALNTLATLFAAAIVGLPFWYRSAMSEKYRNFRTVEPGVLYRSGQMSPAGFQTVVREYGIRSVVCLREARSDGREPPDETEAAFCRANGVSHTVFSPRHWDAPPGAAAPVEDNLRRFLALVAEPKNHPVLVHCFAGIHRTGGYVSLYRIEFGGWPAADAVAEMERMGTPRTTFDDKISGFLRRYEPGKLRPQPGVGGAAGGR